ncbi:UNVERIFIED_CONTAM: UV-B-induced protein, chloroplastic [Sesamum radiatum]|uniref:UV-B-induced protein, chloroplastic n=1 Tax=Sesamum radiatum TaxID=300843 RepID=A0AAW2I6I0_SESRA
MGKVVVALIEDGTIAAFRASFSSVSPNWVARSGSARPDLRVGSRSLLSNSWIRWKQQLEQLQTDRDAEKEKEEPAASGTELVFNRRIAEVKANERRKALEEILYALVVQKFMDANVSLIPTITPSSPDNSGRVDSWPSQDDNWRASTLLKLMR